MFVCTCNGDTVTGLHTAEASTVYINGQSHLYKCRAKSGGGVALKASAIFMRDFATLTQCRAWENGGGILTSGVCDVSISGPVSNMRVSIKNQLEHEACTLLEVNRSYR